MKVLVIGQGGREHARSGAPNRRVGFEGKWRSDREHFFGFLRDHLAVGFFPDGVECKILNI